jgi:hypothetical protein
MEKQHDRNGNPTVAVVHFAGGYDDFGNKKRGWNSPARPAGSYAPAYSTTKTGTFYDQSAGMPGRLHRNNSEIAYGINLVGYT